MDQLEELYREFDVTQSSGPQFDLSVDLMSRDIFRYPPPHRLDRFHKSVPLGGRPHQVGHRRGILRAEIRVSGNRAGLEQGLELPGLRPARVVLKVGIEGSDQRTVLALGTQIGVHLPQPGLPPRRRHGT